MERAGECQDNEYVQVKWKFPFFFSTNPNHALPINEGPKPLSVQTYCSFHGY